MSGTSRSGRILRVVAIGGLIGSLVSISALSQTVQAATSTWTGLGGDALWSNAGNWSGGAPVAGSDLVFPNGPTIKFNSNDFAHGTVFWSITIQDGGYTMGGNSVETDEITVIAGPTSTASAISWNNGNAPFTGLTVPSGGTTTIDVGAGAEVQMNMSVSLGANSLVYAIDGRLTTTHNYVFSAGADITRNGTETLLITSGRRQRQTIFHGRWMRARPTSTPTTTSPPSSTLTGGVFGGNFGQTHGLNIVGGTLSPGNETFETGFLQVESGNIVIGPGGTFEVDINGVNEFDRLTTSNSGVLARRHAGDRCRWLRPDRWHGVHDHQQRPCRPGWWARSSAFPTTR